MHTLISVIHIVLVLFNTDITSKIIHTQKNPARHLKHPILLFRSFLQDIFYEKVDNPTVTKQALSLAGGDLYR